MVTSSNTSSHRIGEGCGASEGHGQDRTKEDVSNGIDTRRPLSLAAEYLRKYRAGDDHNAITVTAMATAGSALEALLHIRWRYGCAAMGRPHAQDTAGKKGFTISQ
jgi:hypothetical protein